MQDLDDVKGLDDTGEEILFTLISKEGEQIQIAKEIILDSGLISTMLENDLNNKVFRLPIISSKTIRHVIEYLTHHHGKPLVEIERPLQSTNMQYVVHDKYDAKFIDMEKESVLDIINAGAYMDIPSLTELGCAKIASEYKDKTKEQREEYFTAEEIKAIEDGYKIALGED